MEISISFREGKDVTIFKVNGKKYELRNDFLFFHDYLICAQCIKDTWHVRMDLEPGCFVLLLSFPNQKTCENVGRLLHSRIQEINKGRIKKYYTACSVFSNEEFLVERTSDKKLFTVPKDDFLNIPSHKPLYIHNSFFEIK